MKYEKIDIRYPSPVEGDLNKLILLSKKYPQYWEYYGVNLFLHKNEGILLQQAFDLEERGESWSPSFQDRIANIAWTCKDKQYWKSIFNFKVFILDPRDRNFSVKSIKQIRYSKRMRILHPYKSYTDLYGDTIANILEKYFREKNYDCMDNYRVCDVSKSNERRKYFRTKNLGCCGCHDERIEIKGKTFLVGFNYGH